LFIFARRFFNVLLMSHIPALNTSLHLSKKLGTNSSDFCKAIKSTPCVDAVGTENVGATLRVKKLCFAIRGRVEDGNPNAR
jgi:hypothetical protein